MKVLVDSNIVLEIILQREQFEAAQSCLKLLSRRNDEAFLTVGGFYGMIYTVENYLRKVMGMKRPGRTAALRSIMIQVLNQYNVAEHDKDSLLRGVSDEFFSDLEDSCQYQAALKEGCTVLLSFNDADYQEGMKSPVSVLTPQEFLESYSTLNE